MKYFKSVFVFILFSISANAQHKVYNGGSHFSFGFARLTMSMQKDSAKNIKNEGYNDDVSDTSIVDFEKPLVQEFYIDSTGKIAFNEIIKGGFYKDSDTSNAHTGSLPTHFVLVKKGVHFGVLTTEGKWLLLPIYDTIDTNFSQEWLVSKNTKKSLFTQKGFLLPFRFDDVVNMDGNYFSVKQNGLWGVYSENKKKLVLPCIYQSIDYCYGCESKGDYCFAEKNGKWGVIDFTGKVLLPFKYDHEHWNMRSDEWVNSFSLNGKRLSINLKTKQVDTCKTYEAKESDTAVLAGGFMRVEQNGKYGFLNPDGKIIFSCIYDYIRYDAANAGGYHNPAPYVELNKNNLWGLADTTGDILIAPNFVSISMTDNNDLFIGELPKKLFYENLLFNSKGNRVLKDTFSNIKEEKTYGDTIGINYLKLKKDTLLGLYNPQTKIYVKPQYTSLDRYHFSVDMPHSVLIKRDGKEGLLDVQTGKEIVPPLFQSIKRDGTPDGFILVSNNEKYGLYNYLEKKLIVPLQYDYISNFNHYKLLKIKIGKGYGLMNYEGEVKVPTQYSSISNLSNYFYLLTKEDSAYHQRYWFYNSRTDKTFTSTQDTVITVLSDTVAIVLRAGKYKLFNPLEDKIIEGEYSQNGYPTGMNIYYLNNKILIYKNGKVGLINASGNYIIPLKYKGLSDFKNGYALFVQNIDSLGPKLYGFIDSTGKVIVPAKYTYDAQRESSDYFLGDKFVLFYQKDYYSKPLMGVASKTGKIIIPPLYDKIFPQKNGNFYLVKQEGTFGILDASASVILPVEFKNIGLDERPLYGDAYKFSFPILVQKDEYWQYYQRNGKPLPIKTKKLIPFENFYNL